MEPTAGEISEGQHVLPIRVYFEDTDASGIVYNASYVRFFERGRTDFLRLLGIEQGASIRDRGADGYFAVRRLEIDYLSPAFLDDALVVSTRLLAVRGASVDIGQLEDVSNIAKLMNLIFEICHRHIVLHELLAEHSEFDRVANTFSF